MLLCIMISVSWQLTAQEKSHSLFSGKDLTGWNRLVIECRKDEITVWVNGDLVNHGYKCTAQKGQIALQAEGAEVEFRKLTITPFNL